MSYIVSIKARVPVGPNDTRTAKTKLIHHGTEEFEYLAQALLAAQTALEEGFWVSVEKS